MKFKISTLKEPKHKNGVICVSWNNTEDVLSCGDDHKLLKWNLASGECNLVATFPDDFYPTGMNLFPKLGIASGGNKQQNEVLLITTADGRFHIVSQNGRIDKSVVGHQGACLAGQWSPDGAGFLTAGEDGLVKLWSRNGLLRSCIVQLDIACYCAVWGPDSMSVLHSKGNFLVIKQLSSNLKTMKWKAHDSIVLCVSWNANNNLIISGCEDGYFKVWDSFGQPLFSSVKHEDPITSSAWAPAGDLFVIGSYNLLRLCNSSGWSHCLDRPTSGGIRNIAWSSDGTQLAAACATGHVLFAHIIDRQLNWKHYTCSLIGRKAIMMKDITSDTSDQLDYPDRVIQLALEHNHLVVATVKQCYVHSLSSWNTPVVFDLKEGTISMILLSERCLCIVERATVTVYSYLGRLLANPKWVNMRPELLGQSSITLGPDTLAVIDQIDKKAIHIFELPTGLVVRSSADYTSTKITHRLTVFSVALSQTGPTNERQLAILDYNKDLYITTVKDSKIKFRKLGTQILGIAWSAECELLAGLQANSIVSWCCPRTANLPDWQTLTTVHKDINDMGRNPCLLAIEDGIAHIYLSNGSLLHVSVVPFPEKLLKHIASNQWQNALKMCRTVEDETLWACLAVLSWHNRELDVAEEAFAMIKHYHQVEYIQHLKSPEKIYIKMELCYFN